MSDTDEITALRAENERLREWNREIALNARELVAENERLRAALREVMDDLTLISKNHWLPVGLLDDVIYVNARAALEAKRISEAAAQPAPSPWSPDALINAANAIIDFYNGPAEAKRPDIFQRLMQRLANALPPAPGKEEA